MCRENSNLLCSYFADIDVNRNCSAQFFWMRDHRCVTELNLLAVTNCIQAWMNLVNVSLVVTEHSLLSPASACMYTFV